MNWSRAVVLVSTTIALVQCHQGPAASGDDATRVGVLDRLFEEEPFATCSLFPGKESLAQDLWEVRLTPTAGRGVFALRDMPRGTHILSEAPLFSVAAPVFVAGKGFEMAAMVADVEHAYTRLTPEDQQVYLSCHEEQVDAWEGAGPGWKLLAIFRSNAYTMQDGRIGIYPKVALINHSCQPNILNADREGTRVIVAMRDIRQGEEILTTYIPLLMDTASRNDRLAQYGFQCSCHACTTRASDAQRVQAGRLLHALEEEQQQFGSHARKRQRQRDAEAVATFVEDQGFADYLVPTSRLASHYAAQARNASSARRWAEKHLRHHEVVDVDSVGARAARQWLEEAMDLDMSLS